MISEDRWGIVYCPKHELLRPHKRWERIEKCLKEQGIPFDFVQSERQGSVDRLVKMMVTAGYKTIVIVGGDSAINDAVNCLMQFDSSIRDGIALGIVPNGVMNDFAHFWGMNESEYHKNIRTVKERRLRRIDLGVMRYRNQEGEQCRRYFANCVNVGLIASIMNLRRKTRHILGSRALSFCFSFVLLIFQRMEYKMHVKINDDDINRRIMTICVGNCSGYGQTPNAVPYNGLLDVSIVKHPRIGQLLTGIRLFSKGRLLNHRSVHPYRTCSVEFVSTGGALVGIDGRLMRKPVGTFTLGVEQEVINMIIPK